MNKEHVTLLQLLQNAILQQNKSVEIEDLQALDMLAVSHFCWPLVYQGALNCGVSLPKTWQDQTLVTVTRNMQNLSVQSRLVRILGEHNIRCVVLKGATVAIHYPEPLLRPLGDIDILVREADYEQAINVLTGSKERNQTSLKHGFHYEFKFDGVSVEIHRGITELTRELSDVVIAEVLQSALESVVCCGYEGFSFPALEPKYQAVVLLAHMKRHFSDVETNLRMLCDWALFVKQTKDEVWHEQVMPLVKQARLTCFSDLITSFCNEYLHIECEHKVSQKVPAEVCQAICEEILSTGTHSTKGASENIGNLYGKYRATGKGRIYSVFGMLNALAEHYFPFVRRYPVLLPIYWIYLPLRYVYRALRGQKKRQSLVHFKQVYERRKELYKYLQENEDIHLKQR